MAICLLAHPTNRKSLTLDEWTKDQVEFMRQNGNLKSNAYYNPNESRNPPPTRMMENERDSELELFIRSKYEHKRFIDKSALVAAKLGPSRAAPVPASQASRAVSSPIVAGTPTLSSQSALGINRPSTSALPETSSIAARQPAARSASHPLPPSTVPLNQQYMKPMPPLPSEARPQHPQAPQPPSDNPVWNDLISLSQPTVSASLPLQMQSTPTQMPQFNIQPNQSFQPTLSLNTGFSSNLQPSQFQGGPSPLAMNPVPSFPAGLGMNNNPPYGTNQFGQQLQQQQQQQQQQQPGTGYLNQPQAAPYQTAMSTGMMSMGQSYPQQQQQQFLQPQPTSAMSMQSQGMLSSSPQPMMQNMQNPMSLSPQPMQQPMQQQQGLTSHSPMLQQGYPSGNSYGGNSPMGTMRMQPSPSPFFQQQQQLQQQPQQQPFGTFQQQQQQQQQQQFGAFQQQQPQQQPGFAAPIQTNQFTGWMQAPVPGQQQQQRWGM
ncbi:hypothetical protein CCMSSC00406_0006169 [Pleurotus cornucopiae]|uniref:Uncharacterized protein n=1 Tax=Pleurotus cornucopiae TaxID=5321 RepID=A0ACB7J9D7_PLECO|nr:hypothetical protein CCMSSC00406_0006169 [Pleurotus cornucopiae]